MKKNLILLFMVVSSATVFSQNVAINSSGSNPDASAILDISSTDKGVLVPRVTTTQRTSISNPAKGLLVFDLDFAGFYFFDGLVWVSLSGNSNSTPTPADPTLIYTTSGF